MAGFSVHSPQTVTNKSNIIRQEETMPIHLLAIIDTCCRFWVTLTQFFLSKVHGVLCKCLAREKTLCCPCTSTSQVTGVTASEKKPSLSCAAHTVLLSFKPISSECHAGQLLLPQNQGVEPAGVKGNRSSCLVQLSDQIGYSTERYMMGKSFSRYWSQPSGWGLVPAVLTQSSLISVKR